jgi:hypothetical protein
VCKFDLAVGRLTVVTLGIREHFQPCSGSSVYWFKSLEQQRRCGR